MSQHEVASILDVPRSTYRNYEVGVSQMDYQILCKAADLFNVTVDELIGRTSSSNLFDNSRIPKTEIQELFDQMTPEQQNHILIYAQGLVAGNSLDKHNKGVKAG